MKCIRMNHFSWMKLWPGNWIDPIPIYQFYSYCKNDVEILTRGLIAFRAEFLEMTRRSAGLDGKADRVYKQTPHSVSFYEK